MVNIVQFFPGTPYIFIMKIVHWVREKLSIAG